LMIENCKQIRLLAGGQQSSFTSEIRVNSTE